MEQKSLFSRLAEIKEELSKANIKKSGFNKYSGFTYYELADILPVIISLCKKHGVYTYTSYTNDLATLVAVNVDKPSETVFITSPMRNFELKGTNALQVLGGVETYSRRYLYLAMFDIVETDSFDANAGAESNVEKKEVDKITPEQIEELKKLGTNFDDLCKYYKINDIKDLSMQQANQCIKLKMKKIQKIENKQNSKVEAK